MTKSQLPEFYVRRVTLDDLKYAEQATAVFNAAYSSDNEGWTSISKIIKDYGTTRETTEDYIRRSVQGQVVQFFAFQRDSEGNDQAVVGSLVVEDPLVGLDHSHFALSGKEGLLGRFSVNPKYQSKGIGRVLMEAGLTAMRETGYTTCLILVFENRDTVLRWYEKLGFVDTGKRVPFSRSRGFEMMQDVRFKLMTKDL
ncbi:acyl-CoA N-acyltransferase [Gilbertella persicaria]|uniref:acyl-CoA N-acyltransferase n=1 Tax=Gilbertella persicaria TaxID=101096 RepID=UPI00221FFE48|nr:acyl-CoA N-acyltransferase [Gilbertella persicaria]KAI8091089.1 acyl-CoA N-acyltransferase [Gilbertella persicaria]